MADKPPRGGIWSQADVDRLRGRRLRFWNGDMGRMTDTTLAIGADGRAYISGILVSLDRGRTIVVSKDEGISGDRAFSVE